MAYNKIHETDALIPGVIYARYSSSGQREESIEGQLRDCHEYARKHGITVVGEYADRALTGRSDKRPDFQRMLRDSERGVFKVVICWKMDRFARNRYDSAMYKYKLKKNGVRILYAKESIPEGPEGIILESVMEGYAEYYSENLSQNIRRGYYDSALELKTLGQKVLGLRKSPEGRFELDPATAPIVRRIFEEYAAGERAKDIIDRLNDEGHRTIHGGLFNKNSIRRILQNEKYIGIYEYKDIRVEDGIPAIVDRELFEKCRVMVERHHLTPAAKRGTSFLLTSKLFCGHCGDPMTGDSGTSHSGRVYNYYTCNGRRVHKCKKERARKDWIEELVIMELVKLIHSDDFVNEVADRCMEFQAREKDRSVLNSLEVRLKEIEKGIQNMLAAIEAGIITPSTKTRLMELEAEQVQVEKGIARELISEPALERDQVIYFLERFRSGDVNDEMYRAFLVDTFLNSVYLYDDDKLILVLNYTGENSKVTLQIVEKAVDGVDSSCSGFAPSTAPKMLPEGSNFCGDKGREARGSEWGPGAAPRAERRPSPQARIESRHPHQKCSRKGAIFVEIRDEKREGVNGSPVRLPEPSADRARRRESSPAIRTSKKPCASMATGLFFMCLYPLLYPFRY